MDKNINIGDTENYRLKLTEENILNELYNIENIIDEIKEIESIYNIKSKVRKLDRENNNNVIIKKKINDVNLQLEKVEENFRYYNGNRYATLEEVQTIKDEVYYIENEAYKFDLLNFDGMQLFLELMSLKHFKAREAKNILDKYKGQFFEMRSLEVSKIEKQELKYKIKKRNSKLKIAMWMPAITFGVLMSTVIINIFAGLWKFTAVAGIIFGLSVPISIGLAIYYLIVNRKRRT